MSLVKQIQQLRAGEFSPMSYLARLPGTRAAHAGFVLSLPPVVVPEPRATSRSPSAGRATRENIGATAHKAVLSDVTHHSSFGLFLGRFVVSPSVRRRSTVCTCFSEPPVGADAAVTPLHHSSTPTSRTMSRPEDHSRS
jgi:hypothetical protein